MRLLAVVVCTLLASHAHAKVRPAGIVVIHRPDEVGPPDGRRALSEWEQSGRSFGGRHCDECLPLTLAQRQDLGAVLDRAGRLLPAVPEGWERTAPLAIGSTVDQLGLVRSLLSAERVSFEAEAEPGELAPGHLVSGFAGASPEGRRHASLRVAAVYAPHREATEAKERLAVLVTLHSDASNFTARIRNAKVFERSSGELLAREAGGEAGLSAVHWLTWSTRKLPATPNGLAPIRLVHVTILGAEARALELQRALDQRAFAKLLGPVEQLHRELTPEELALPVLEPLEEMEGSPDPWRIKGEAGAAEEVELSAEQRRYFGKMLVAVRDALPAPPAPLSPAGTWVGSGPLDRRRLLLSDPGALIAKKGRKTDAGAFPRSLYQVRSFKFGSPPTHLTRVLEGAQTISGLRHQPDHFRLSAILLDVPHNPKSGERVKDSPQSRVRRWRSADGALERMEWTITLDLKASAPPGVAAPIQLLIRAEGRTADVDAWAEKVDDAALVRTIAGL